MLRDRITCGINYVAIQRRLLDFAKALNMANEDPQHLQTGQLEKVAPQQTEEEVHMTSGKGPHPGAIKTVTGVE